MAIWLVYATASEVKGRVGGKESENKLKIYVDIDARTPQNLVLAKLFILVMGNRKQMVASKSREETSTEVIKMPAAKKKAAPKKAVKKPAAKKKH